MKCPVCDKQIENVVQKCPNCGFADLRTEFINENELEMWRTYVVYPCRFAYEISVAQAKDLQRKFQKEITAIKKVQKESADSLVSYDESTTSAPLPFKKFALQKKDGWLTKDNISIKIFNECYYHGLRLTRCEITNTTIDIVGNKATIHFFAKKVWDSDGNESTKSIAFKWKLKDDYGIVVANGSWRNNHLNVGDVTKGDFSISGIDPSVHYVIELANDD